jgi:pyruvate formate-lyase activating enzyme-like uncharacterized protein
MAPPPQKSGLSDKVYTKKETKSDIILIYGNKFNLFEINHTDTCYADANNLLLVRLQDKCRNLSQNIFFCSSRLADCVDFKSKIYSFIKKNVFQRRIHTGQLAVDLTCVYSLNRVGLKNVTA